MSIQTMNWALQQRLESPYHQCLLYVIADSAAPDGTTRHCDSDYLVKHSRMSRASVFRKLADLRDWGLVETFTHHGERGQQIYEVRLQLKKFVDMPIKKRKSGDDEGESHSETPAETGQNGDGESHSETGGQSQAETAAVAPVRPGQSQSGDRICPPLSEESPPNPPPGGVEESEADKGKRAFHRAGFQREYPRPGRWDWSKVDPVFGAMTLADCEHAHAAAPHYAREFTRPSQTPKRPEAWLRSRMFENFPDAKIPDAPQAAPEPVWYPDDGEEFRALAVAHALAGERPPSTLSREGFHGRWIKRYRPIGPDLLRLAAWHDAIKTGGFPEEHSAGSGSCEAWRARLSDWLGREVKPQRIWAEPHDPAVHDLPVMNPNFKVRRSFMGLRAPWRWPPRKDGTLSDEDASREAAMVPDDDFQPDEAMEQEHERDVEDR